MLTLQCFPHVGAELAPALRPQVAVLVDEAHRSHADKALTEQLLRVVGCDVKLRSPDEEGAVVGGDVPLWACVAFALACG